ncbi:MAG: hypothetical protein Kapaf2KO_21890 [Candidatus Kapaibacteriales bacterium]
MTPNRTNTSNIIIRFSKIEDAPAIAHIYNSAIEAGGSNAYTELLPLSHFESMIAEHKENENPLIVAIENDETIGLAYLSHYRCGRKALAVAAEMSFYIHPDHRRKGIAQALIKKLESLTKELKKTAIFGIILDTNTASIELMKSLGYTQWAYLPKVASFNGNLIGQVYYGKNI